MGFGGSAAAMITSLKNNKRNRVSALEKLKNHKKGNAIQVKFDKKANKIQLKQIREKLQAENKRKLRRNIILFVLGILIIIYAIGFVKF
ncbi:MULTISPECIES: hypothetical protein [unclassified Polaribacter]|uniref:hypothetical protein n=1 Tax=unclassified Polaribacter TaxID=196858 RepID=UPI000068CA72|nr:hypothetical protein [Polaribacter sp. MED152]EAQ42570.1 hypothetical protein MED152_07610 [Polaribacter sp. MED152]